MPSFLGSAVAARPASTTAPRHGDGPHPGGASLMPERQRLIDAMRRIGFGRIENVVICGGSPHITKDTKQFRLLRDGPEPQRRPGRAFAGAVRLHAQHVRLLADCVRIGRGVLTRIEVADGLPVHWEQAGGPSKFPA